MDSEKLLLQILSELEGLKTELHDFKQETNARLDQIDKKMDITIAQTAELTEFRTEVRKGMNEMTEQQKSLFEMYGDHEAAIRALRRRPV